MDIKFIKRLSVGNAFKNIYEFELDGKKYFFRLSEEWMHWMDKGFGKNDNSLGECLFDTEYAWKLIHDFIEARERILKIGLLMVGILI